MRIDFLTLFPDMIMAVMGESIVKRGVDAGYLEINYVQIRDFTENKQKKVDDYPYGGGPGLIMQYQPIVSAYESVSKDGEKPYCVYMSPQGKTFNQEVARRLSKQKHLVILCGHYEGIDERVIEEIVDEEISAGDFVLTGGEIPAMMVADSVARLVPGVLASEDATVSESHSEGLLEYPQYSRPAEINGRKVPEVLQRGNHGEIEKWRFEQSLERTKIKRPDLYEKYCAAHGMLEDKNDKNFFGNTPESKKIYYLDNSATTRPSKWSLEAAERSYRDFYGNPSSLHLLGMEAENELTRARARLSSILRVRPSEIIFTSCATEANNTAIRGYMELNSRKGKHILYSAAEHPSVSETVRALCKKEGYECDEIPLDQSGRVDIEALAGLIRPETALICVLHVNSETGAIQPIREVVATRNRINKNTAILTDCVQSLGKIEIYPSEFGVDMITASSHKLNAPRGSGLLWVRSGIRIAPLLYGGGQEKGLRSGTENVAAASAFAEAAEKMYSSISINYSNAVKMRDCLIEKTVPRLSNAVILTDIEKSSPYILNISFEGVRAEVLQHELEKNGVYVSVGSACSSHKKNRSSVLTAMGVKNEIIDCAIRISFSPYTTMEEIEGAAPNIVEAVKKLRRQSARRKTREEEQITEE